MENSLGGFGASMDYYVGFLLAALTALAEALIAYSPAGGVLKLPAGDISYNLPTTSKNQLDF